MTPGEAAVVRRYLAAVEEYVSKIPTDDEHVVAEYNDAEVCLLELLDDPMPETPVSDYCESCGHSKTRHKTSIECQEPVQVPHFGPVPCSCPRFEVIPSARGGGNSGTAVDLT